MEAVYTEELVQMISTPSHGNFTPFPNKTFALLFS